MSQDAGAQPTTPAISDDAPKVVVIGGGPGGYEGALVAAQLGARVTVIEKQGWGGAAVLTDVVPSKTLISTAELMTQVAESVDLGVRFPGGASPATDLTGAVQVDMDVVNRRVRTLAKAQSRDIRQRLQDDGVETIEGSARLVGQQRVAVTRQDGREITVEADVVLLAVGATPRVQPGAEPDGERILSWTQLYELTELPEHLIVVGSGVTGAEFAGAYDALGSEVTLVSSRNRVLPGHDADAADLIEKVFTRRGMNLVFGSRAQQAKRTGDGVVVTLEDGRTVEGSHVLMAVGSIPATSGLGLDVAGVATSASGHITVDRVSRTSRRNVYAAGDCTGVLPLASVAAMQGRIAMWHALGDAVQPINLTSVSANIFTAPEIATVGAITEEDTAGLNCMTLHLNRNPRAKMQAIQDGFLKLYSRPECGTVVGGVVVAPKASELIFPIAIAVEHRLSVEDIAHAFTVYPSLTGTIAEAARRLHHFQNTYDC